VNTLTKCRQNENYWELQPEPHKNRPAPQIQARNRHSIGSLGQGILPRNGNTIEECCKFAVPLFSIRVPVSPELSRFPLVKRRCLQAPTNRHPSSMGRFSRVYNKGPVTRDQEHFHTQTARVPA
jgi:hypothetical protein